MLKKLASYDWKKYVPWILLAMVFLTICYAIKCANYLDSDLSSELVLAHLLSEEKTLISKNWYYSTELRVLNTQLVFTPLFYVFQSWHRVRVCGSVILLVILLACFYYFCRQTKSGMYFPYLAILLLLPFSTVYSQMVVYGLYYVPHIAISFLSFAMGLQIINSRNRKGKVVLTVCLCGMAFLAGLGGPRQLLVLYLPVFLSSAIVSLCQKNKKTARFFAMSMVTLLCAVLGYLVNSSILSEIYSFESWDSLQYVMPSWETIWTVITGFLSTYGYRKGDVFSIITVYNLLCLLFVVLIFAGVFYSVKNFFCGAGISRDSSSGELVCTEDSGFEDMEIAMFFLIAFLVFVLLYSATDMSYVDRYNIPVAVFGIPVLGIGMKKVNSSRKSKYVVYVLFLLGMIYCGEKTNIAYKRTDTTAEMRNLSAFLKENEYYNGYSTFWTGGNVLTELSDGEIDMRVWSTISQIDNADVDQIFEWLQLTDHKNSTPDGKVFLLFTETEYSETTFRQYLNEDNIIYQSGGYIVFGFEDYEALISCLTDYTVTFEDGLYLTNGEDQEGVRYIYSGGNSYGPYMTLYAGDYEVTIEGGSLDAAEFSCTGSSGEKVLNITDLDVSEEKATYQIHLDDTVYNVEFCIANNTEEETIMVSQIHVQFR